jgi:hypothetical protein
MPLFAHPRIVNECADVALKRLKKIPRDQITGTVVQDHIDYAIKVWKGITSRERHKLYYPEIKKIVERDLNNPLLFPPLTPTAA